MSPTTVVSGPLTTTEVVTQINGPLQNGARLVPMDLEQPHEREMLYQQRVICSWGSDRIDFWRASMAKGERTIFWITLPYSEETAAKLAGTPPLKRNRSSDEGTDEFFAVGHISLDKVDSPSDPDASPDLTLASEDGEILQITSLFVLPQFGSLRLGSFAMDECERLAQQEPYGSSKCRAVTLTTLSSRCLPGPNAVEGPDGIGRWEWLGIQMDMPKKDNAIWYARRGYVSYKEELRYGSHLADGTKISWYGLCMRKELDNPRLQA